MQTSLDPKWEALIDLTEVDTILRSCGIAGFALGCPTYQLLGDENDILADATMKQVFEGDSSFETVALTLTAALLVEVARQTVLGVEYGRLLIFPGIMHRPGRALWSRLKRRS